MTHMKSVFLFLMAQPIRNLGILLYMLMFIIVIFVSQCIFVFACMYLMYYFLYDNVLSCSSRTAIDEFECRARSC